MNQSEHSEAMASKIPISHRVETFFDFLRSTQLLYEVVEECLQPISLSPSIVHRHSLTEDWDNLQYIHHPCDITDEEIEDIERQLEECRDTTAKPFITRNLRVPVENLADYFKLLLLEMPRLIHKIRTMQKTSLYNVELTREPTT